MFVKQNYVTIAKVLSKIPNDPTKEKIVQELTEAFASDNPMFNKIVFVMECNGIKPNAVAWKMGERGGNSKPKPTPTPTGGVRRWKMVVRVTLKNLDTEDICQPTIQWFMSHNGDIIEVEEEEEYHSQYYKVISIQNESINDLRIKNQFGYLYIPRKYCEDFFTYSIKSALGLKKSVDK